MRLVIATLCATTLLVASCGGDDGSVFDPDAEGDTGVGGQAGARTADIEPCELLTEAELTAVLGEAPLPDPSEPAGPFTGCSWGTGDVLVSIATADTLILAPGEDECPSAGLGDESYLCEGRVKFLTNGIHVTVSTIDPFLDDELLVALATVVLPKLQE